MLSTAQENAVRAWLSAAIGDCPELEAVPLDRIVWGNQNFPDQAYPRIELNYTGATQLGADSPQSVDGGTDELLTRDEDNTTLSITFITKIDDAAPSRDQAASSYLREVKGRRRSFVASPLSAANLSIRQIFTVPDSAILQGKSQWESRAVLDITFGTATVVREAPGVIETAVIDGTTTPPTPNRTITVQAP